MKDTVWNFLGGAAMGVLVGVLAGLSISPVVSSLLGAFATAAMTLISLKNTKPAIGSLARVAGFGAACAAGLVSGVYLRANNLLGLQPVRAIRQLTAAGFSEAEARKLFLQQQTDSAATAKATGKLAPSSGALFASDSSELAAIKDMLALNHDWESIRSTMRAAHPTWVPVVEALNGSGLAEDAKRQLLLALVSMP